MAGQLMDAQPEPTEEELQTPDGQVEEQTTEPEADDIPEKYKGKGIKDLIQMHQEVEKAIGKQSGEVGELRKIVDEQIQAQLEQRPTETPKAEESVDWFSDPDKALEQRLNSHPKIKDADRAAAQMQKQMTLAALEKAHPNYKQTLNDPKFQTWVKKSQVRQKLLYLADQSYDFDSANELFETWNDLQSVTQKVDDTDKKARTEQVKQASSGSARGGQPSTRKKKFRRADIMRLRRDDPERYAAMADEILLAYSEGRVV